MKKLPGFLKLGKSDFIKGLILAILVGLLTFFQEIYASGAEIDWHKLVVAVIIAFLGYLVKNLFTNTKGEFAKPDPKDEQVG